MIRFDEWVALHESAAHQASELLLAITKAEDRGKLTASEIGAIERRCARLLALTPEDQVNTRPVDVIEDEWREPAVLGARERLASLRGFAKERSPNLEGWLRDLRVACEDYADAWRWFERKVER